MPQTTARKLTIWAGVALTVVGAILLAVSFIQTVRAYAELPKNNGSSLVLGVPIGAFTMSLAVVIIVLAAALAARRGTSSTAGRLRRVLLGIALLSLGIIGWYAAYALAVDKMLTALQPTAQLGCDISLLVQCGANLESWQGSVFGFPNPLIGLVGWAAVITVGCLLLVGIHLAPWFWIAFNLGVAGAVVFVCWLIGQSILVLGTLCPWCMVTWAVTIPLFWAITLHNAKAGRFGERAASILGPAYDWVPAITLASYIVVAVIAQARLDVLAYL